MTSLDHHLDRFVDISARPDTVFRFFTDPARWAGWWGAGSTIDPTPGGRVLIRYPGNVEAAGEVVEIAPPERIVFTYGYASGTPFPPGASRVTIHVRPTPTGSRVELRHDLPDEASRDAHVQGWRHQLSVFANAVGAADAARAGALADEWFAVWAETDSAERRRRVLALVEPGIRVRDAHSALVGVEDLLPHIEAAQKFMPGVRLAREGDVRLCQGTALCRWTARSDGQAPVGAGTNVFEISQDGRLSAVTGFWAER